MRFDWRESGCQALSELQHLVVGEGEASQGKTGCGLTQRRMGPGQSAPGPLLPPQKQYGGGYDGRATIGFLTHSLSSHVTQTDSLPPGKKEAVVWSGYKRIKKAVPALAISRDVVRFRFFNSR